MTTVVTEPAWRNAREVDVGYESFDRCTDRDPLQVRKRASELYLVTTFETSDRARFLNLISSNLSHAGRQLDQPNLQAQVGILSRVVQRVLTSRF